MKFWANDLNIGDSFYYVQGFIIKHGTIVDRNKGPLTRMEYWNLDNGDVIFVNTYVSDDPKDFLEELIEEIQNDIEQRNTKIQLYQSILDVLNICLHKYLKAKEEDNYSDIVYNEQK